MMEEGNREWDGEGIADTGLLNTRCEEVEKKGPKVLL